MSGKLRWQFFKSLYEFKTIHYRHLYIHKYYSVRLVINRSSTDIFKRLFCLQKCFYRFTLPGTFYNLLSDKTIKLAIVNYNKMQFLSLSHMPCRELLL